MIKFAAILSSILIGSFGYSFAQNQLLICVTLAKIDCGSIKFLGEISGVAWNSVNFAIAGLGYFVLKADAATFSLTETVKEYQRFDNILLFNAGIDVGYMATGAFLWERALKKESARLTGYGQSLILQEAFLFTFDLNMFFASRNQSRTLIDAFDGALFGQPA